MNKTTIEELVVRQSAQAFADTKDIPEDIILKAISKYCETKNLVFVLCFFLIWVLYSNEDYVKYNEELEQLLLSQEMEREKRDEWFRKKYERLKVLANLPFKNIIQIDSFVAKKIDLSDAVSKLKNTRSQTLK